MTAFWNVHMRFDTNEYDYNNATRGLIVIYWHLLGDLQDLVSLGDQIDFNQQIMTKLQTAYPNNPHQGLVNWQASLRYFVWEMQIGDFVLSSTPDQICYLGVIQSGYFFNYHHYRKVDWKMIPKSVLSPDLIASLGAKATVFRVDKHREEIGSLYLKFCL